MKYNAQGEVDCYKCPLVVQGFRQKPGLDYTETIAPVAKFATIRTLIAFAAQSKMHIHQWVFLMWKGDQLTIVTCYVDDLIQVADAIEDIENLKRELSDTFHMTDLGQMNFCLGITVLQDRTPFSCTRANM